MAALAIADEGLGGDASSAVAEGDSRSGAASENCATTSATAQVRKPISTMSVSTRVGAPIPTSAAFIGARRADAVTLLLDDHDTTAELSRINIPPVRSRGSLRVRPSSSAADRAAPPGSAARSPVPGIAASPTLVAAVRLQPVIRRAEPRARLRVSRRYSATRRQSPSPASMRGHRSSGETRGTIAGRTCPGRSAVACGATPSRRLGSLRRRCTATAPRARRISAMPIVVADAAGTAPLPARRSPRKARPALDAARDRDRAAGARRAVPASTR